MPFKRGMSLAPNGLRVLEKLGLLGDLERIGRKLHKVKYYKSSGELLVAYDYNLLNTQPNYLVSFLPHELEVLLRKHALDKNVKIYEGASFEAFARENGQISGVQTTIDGKRHELTGKVVVGADGGKSKVREAAGIRSTTAPLKSSYVVTVADEVDGSRDEACHYLAKGKMLGSFSVPHGKYLFYYLPAGAIEVIKANGLDRFKADLFELAPELKGTLGNLHSWDDFPYMVPQDVRVDSWVADHVALIGDAVHSIEPSLGQGGSLTLSDVDALLNVLDECFAKSDFSSNALKAYEFARRPQTEVLQRMAELTAMLMNTSNSAVGWFRDRTLRKMRDNPGAMMLALEIATGTKQSVTLWEKIRLAGLF
jgi:2-polyprenyl-6-methoxyphenol hydroxylase-like FAD-dependent oxidoreductase